MRTGTNAAVVSSGPVQRTGRASRPRVLRRLIRLSHAAVTGLENGTKATLAASATPSPPIVCA